MTRVKALYRSWAIPCTGKQVQVYGLRHRAEWLKNTPEPGCVGSTPKTLIEKKKNRLDSRRPSHGRSWAAGAAKALDGRAWLAFVSFRPVALDFDV